MNTDLVTIWPNDSRLSRDLNSYRYDEIHEAFLEVDGMSFKAVYSLRKMVHLNSVISLIRMVIITVVMGVSVIFFQKSTLTIVINPIERMLEKVKLIARNPLAAAQEEQIKMAGIMTMMYTQSQKN